MDVTSYALSKKYTQETSSEFGAVKGANCQISNTEIDSDGNTVITFKWVNTAGQERTSTATIMKGVIGEKGERGEKGDKGDSGGRGEQGVQGVPGEKGEQGEKGDTGISISSVTVRADSHLICLLSDGGEIDAGVIGTSAEVILTKAEYDALEEKNPTTLYYVIDDIEQFFADQKVMKVISLTRAEYDALEEKDPDIYYDVEDEEYGMFIDDECYDLEMLENKIWSGYKSRRSSKTIYVDYENGSDDNDGLTKETPIKHMTNSLIANKYGGCYAIVIYLLSDYDIEGVPVSFSQQSVNFYGGESEADSHKIYSSLPISSSMMSFSANSKVNLRYFTMEISTGFSGSYFISFSSGNGYIEKCKFIIGAVSKKPSAFIEATRSLVYSTGCTFDCGENNTTTSIIAGGCGMFYLVKPTTVRTVKYVSQSTGSVLTIWMNGGTLNYTTLIRYPTRGNLILLEGVIQKDFIKFPIPECPTNEPGNYILKAVVTEDGVVNYQWVNEVSGISLASDTPVAYSEEEE